MVEIPGSAPGGDKIRTMKVTFTRTGERRYRVSVEGHGVIPAVMDPAPGYDPKMPHDMAHFIVENELGIKGGVFGQLAAGGHAGTFRPIEVGKKAGRKTRTGDRIAAASRRDADLSERLVNLACRTWTGDHPEDAHTVKGYTEQDILRVCRRFDAVSAVWKALKVGGSLMLEWQEKRPRR